MKAEMPLSNGDNTACLPKKKDRSSYADLKFPKIHSATELPENESGFIVIPVDNLNALEFRKLQEVPGAYLLPSVSGFNEENDLSAHQDAVTEERLTPYKQRFLVKHSTKLLSITNDQIAYFYADNRLN